MQTDILSIYRTQYTAETATFHQTSPYHIHRKRGRICIEVFNTCNLPDISDLDKIFDRFYRMDESRSKLTGGTGIGLSMAQAIAEAHGGRIRVKSMDGKTICFKIIL